MSRAGKPLRFLGAVVGGWVLLRLGAVGLPLLWETREDVAASAETVRLRAATASSRATVPAGKGMLLPPLPSAAHHPPHRSVRRVLSFVDAAFTKPVSAAGALHPSPDTAVAPAVETPSAYAPVNPVSGSVPTLLPSTPRTPRASHWSLAAWALWRPDGGAGLAQVPLLGGSQAGLRLDYRLWSAGSRSLNLYGRIRRALERPFAEEAALGLSLRPVEGLPIALLAERRQRLGTGGRNAFAFMAAGGIGPKDIAPRVAIEGYAQAGIVTAPGSDGFADGRFSIDYRLTRKPSQPDLAIGVVASAGAQTGASRLDVGPEVRVRLPVAGGHVRLSAEWRERIAGTARPVSGPALTLVADF